AVQTSEVSRRGPSHAPPPSTPRRHAGRSRSAAVDAWHAVGERRGAGETLPGTVMKFYVLTQKQDVGCPLGMLNGVLVDGFDPDVHKTNYGLQPWYANPARGLPHEPFPETLCFVTKDPKYAFAIRSKIP